MTYLETTKTIRMVPTMVSILLTMILFISCNDDSTEETGDGVGVISINPLVANVLQKEGGRIEDLDYSSFNVDIEDSEGNIILSYDDYSDVPAFIELATGVYNVVIYSDITPLPAFEAGHYSGSSGNFIITNGATTTVDVEIVLGAVKVDITYDAEVSGRYDTIITTIKDITGDSLTYNKDETRSGFFNAGDLKVDIIAKGVDDTGGLFSDKRSVTIIGTTNNEHYTVQITTPPSSRISGINVSVLDPDAVSLEIKLDEGFLTPKWLFSTGGQISYSKPAIADDGTVYVGSRDGKLYAINPDGTQQWAFTTSGQINNTPSVGADGTLYIGSDDGKFYAVNSDGTPKWDYNLGNNVDHLASAIDSDGTIYVGGQADSLFAFNSDGSVKWKTFTEGGTLSLALGAGGVLYANTSLSTDRKLRALNTADGSEAWSLAHGQFAGGSMAIGGEGTIYFVADKVYAVNADGTEKWSYPLSAATTRGGIVLDVAGNVYAATKSDGLLSLATSDGSLNWVYSSFGANLLAAPVIASNGNLFIGDQDGGIYVIDASGAEVFSSAVGGRVWSSAAIDDEGTIYFGSYDNNLYAFESFYGGLMTSDWPCLGKNAKNTNSF